MDTSTLEEEPMTDAELAAELDAVAGATSLPDYKLPAMLPADILAELLYSVSGSALDLWTLRDAIEAHASHTENTLALLPSIAGHLDAACELLEAVAQTLGILLPVESPLFED
jgi:hypothetical protein